jgi:PTS system nitrogen regulatory IIA component
MRDTALPPPGTTPISELIGAADVLFDDDSTTKEALFEKAAALLAARHGLPRRAIYDSLMARERLGSTALGHGFALPHARMALLPNAVAAFVRTRAPIPFDAPDRRPVTHFIFLLVPTGANERHLALMASAAALFADRTFRERLPEARDPATVARLCAEGPAPGKET